MSDPLDIPYDLHAIETWLRQHFGHWTISEQTRIDLDRVFATLTHRGNSRELWFDVLWIKVQNLRAEGATWQHAVHTALDSWNETDPLLPHAWREPAYRSRNPDKLLNLVQQLKNRKEDVIDLGIQQVTDAHFWIALVAGRHAIAARVFRAAKPRLRTQLRILLREMASQTVG